MYIYIYIYYEEEEEEEEDCLRLRQDRVRGSAREGGCQFVAPAIYVRVMSPYS